MDADSPFWFSRRPVVTTPSSAPNKIRKVGPSPLVHSTKQQLTGLSHSAAPRGRKPPIPSGKVGELREEV